MEKMLEIEKVKKGYKQTSIGLIPDDWEVKKLSQLGEVINGLTYSPEDIKPDGILVLRSSNIKDRQLEFNDNVFVNTDKYNPVRKGDILICVRNGSKALIGKNAMITSAAEGLAFGAFMAVFRGNQNDFLFQIFGTDLYQKEIHRNLGATINSINGSDLKLFKFPIPPLPEQQKIAAILSTWDEALSKQKLLVEQTKKRNKGIAQQLLTGKKRLKGFDGEWNNLKFGEVINRITRRNDIENTNVVTISAKRGFVRQDDFFNKQVASETLTNYYLIKKGEFAYNKSYSGGYPMGAFKRLDNFDFGVVTTLYICFSIKNDFDSDFFKHYFEAGQMTHGLTKIAQEGGRAHGLLNIGLTDFLSLKIKVPTLPEQKAISQLIENAELELKLQESQLESLQNEKKGLMQMLLTGEVRVKVI
jgi:type I restriction enzyme S subunit